jgi:hypothetical protein
MNVSFDFSGMLDIVHKSTIEILRCEVGESLQEGFLCMIDSDGFNNRPHSNSGTSNPGFPATNFCITHDVVRQGPYLASLLAFCSAPRACPK